MGRETSASTRNFQRLLEYVIQYAIGSPRTTSTAATNVANLTVSQNACQSISVFPPRMAVPNTSMRGPTKLQEL